VASSPARRPLDAAVARQRNSSLVPSPWPRAGAVTSTMLIHTSSGPNGSVSALASQRPSAALLPKPRPSSSIRRQSPATWFQPAPCASGQSAAAPAGLRRPMSPVTAFSVLAIAHLIVRRLAIAGHAAGEPVGGPIDHALDRYPWRSELEQHALGVVDPARRRLLTAELGLAPETPSKLLRQLPH